MVCPFILFTGENILTIHHGESEGDARLWAYLEVWQFHRVLKKLPKYQNAFKTNISYIWSQVYVLLYETFRQFYSVHPSTIEYFPKSILEVDQRRVKKLKVEIAFQQFNCLSPPHFVFTKQSSFIIWRDNNLLVARIVFINSRKRTLGKDWHGDQTHSHHWGWSSVQHQS